MVQRTIVVNQFTAAYLIEFTAEPRWCNRPLVILAPQYLTNDIDINVYLGDVFCSGRWHEGDCDILVRR